jgi:hypothetical protein
MIAGTDFAPCWRGRAPCVQAFEVHAMTGGPSGFTLDQVKSSRETKTSSPVQENFAHGFRRRFIARFSLVVGVLFGLWSTYLYLALARNFDGNYGLGFLSLVHVRSDLFRYVLYSTVVQATVLAVLTGTLTILFSHKIAGPVFRMKRFLRTWRAGERSPGGMRLRHGDQVQRFAAALETSLGDLSKRSHDAAAKAEALATSLESGDGLSEAALASLREDIERFRVG